MDGAWLTKHFEALRRTRHRCQICNSRHQLQVHHTTCGHGGDLSPDGWHYDHARWCVTLATALGWCLVWLMSETGEIGIQRYAS